jgi:dienelactone hydrolase
MKISLNQKIIIGIVALVPCFFGISCIYLHPLLYNTPLATGPYAIGTTHLYWIDDSRIDKRFPSGKREIRIEFFYPSIRENEDLLFPYQPEKINALKIIKSEYFSLPSFIWRCLLDGIYSHANPEAYFNTKEPLYPVIIFLPGIGGDNFYNTYLEELASHGYIVVALEPPFDTSVTVLSNGTFVGLDNSLIYAAKHGLRDEIYAYRTKAHKNWNEDIDFVLKKLKKLNNDSSSQFYKKFDFNNVGFLGHSHGGAVVTEYCAIHDICKAGINMDGWTKTVNTTNGFDKPFLFLLNEEGIEGVDELYKNMNHEITQKIEVFGAKHAAFSDYILLKKPLVYFWVASDPEAIKKQICDYIISFFDRWLKK